MNTRNKIGYGLFISTILAPFVIPAFTGRWGPLLILAGSVTILAYFGLILYLTSYKGDKK